MTDTNGPLTAAEALQRLREGNQRFVSGERRLHLHVGPAQRDDLVGGQHPFAVILGCSDSRVPVEIVFDEGLGELFVIRVAGNIVAPSLIGSVEFAAENFGTGLVVVLGHTHCGAVEATLADIRQPGLAAKGDLSSIVDRIRPTVAGLVDGAGDDPLLMQRAVRANVRHSVEQLRKGSSLLEARMQAGSLDIIGAEYDLETGVVDFLDDGSRNDATGPGAGT